MDQEQGFGTEKIKSIKSLSDFIVIFCLVIYVTFRHNLEAKAILN